MKKILITGADSYIGVSFERYLQKWQDAYKVDTLDMRNDVWHDHNFSGYDAVFHVAGIAHSDHKKITDEQKALYYKVNTDLTVATAEKAKKSGVRQFVFMSSSIVYGHSAPLGKDKKITKDTKPSPANSYGDSKLRAEQGLSALEDDSFRIVILRPPMIYGKGSKGNYPTLAKLARKLPLFPKVENRRSMLYIDNLCEFVRLMIENEEQGTFFPQNNEFSNTSQLVREIASQHGKKVRLIGGMVWLLKFLSHLSGQVDKAFGNFWYDPALSRYKTDYALVSLVDSLKKTEE